MPARATIRDVAERAGVSVGTASNFVSAKKRISPTTRAKIEAAIRELGWIPNAAVRAIRGSRSPVIGFLIPDSGNPFFTEVAKGIEDTAIAGGGLVVTCDTAADPQREDHFAKSLSEIASQEPSSLRRRPAIGTWNSSLPAERPSSYWRL